MQIAHIVNPIKAKPASELSIAQPITFETIKSAISNVSKEHQVFAYAAVFEEDISAIPDFFNKHLILDRSVLDIHDFKIKRKLPLLADILNLLYSNSHADYFVYSNADIALQPYFYNFIIRTIESGIEAFVINRRTISKHPCSINDIPLMMAQIGESHKGFDCFVFRRNHCYNYYLAETCIGINMVGKVLVWNMALEEATFREFFDVHLTFHLGNEKSWLSDENKEYDMHNYLQAKRVIETLNQQHIDALKKLKSLNLLKPHQFFKKLYPDE